MPHGKPAKRPPLTGGHWAFIRGHAVYLKDRQVVAGGKTGLTHDAKSGHPLHPPDHDHAALEHAVGAAHRGEVARVNARRAANRAGKHPNAPARPLKPIDPPQVWHAEVSGPRSRADARHLAEATARGSHAIAIEPRPHHEALDRSAAFHRDLLDSIHPHADRPGAIHHFVDGTHIGSVVPAPRAGVPDRHLSVDHAGHELDAHRTRGGADNRIGREVRGVIRESAKPRRLIVPRLGDFEPGHFIDAGHGDRVAVRAIRPVHEAIHGHAGHAKMSDFVDDKADDPATFARAKRGKGGDLAGAVWRTINGRAIPFKNGRPVPGHGPSWMNKGKGRAGKPAAAKGKAGGANPASGDGHPRSGRAEDHTPSSYARKHGISVHAAARHLEALHYHGMTAKDTASGRYHIPKGTLEPAIRKGGKPAAHGKPAGKPGVSADHETHTARSYARKHGITHAEAKAHLHHLNDNGKTARDPSDNSHFIPKGTEHPKGSKLDGPGHHAPAKPAAHTPQTPAHAPHDSRPLVKTSAPRDQAEQDIHERAKAKGKAAMILTSRPTYHAAQGGIAGGRTDHHVGGQRVASHIHKDGAYHVRVHHADGTTTVHRHASKDAAKAHVEGVVRDRIAAGTERHFVEARGDLLRTFDHRKHGIGGHHRKVTGRILGGGEHVRFAETPGAPGWLARLWARFNCGTGAGGFKSGNKCGHAGTRNAKVEAARAAHTAAKAEVRKHLAAHKTASRKAAKAGTAAPRPTELHAAIRKAAAAHATHAAARDAHRANKRAERNARAREGRAVKAGKASPIGARPKPPVGGQGAKPRTDRGPDADRLGVAAARHRRLAGSLRKRADQLRDQSDRAGGSTPGGAHRVARPDSGPRGRGLGGSPVGVGSVRERSDAVQRLDMHAGKLEVRSRVHGRRAAELERKAYAVKARQGRKPEDAKETPKAAPRADPDAISHVPGVDTKNPEYRRAAEKRANNNLEHAREMTRGTTDTPEKYLDDVSRGFAEMVGSGDHYIRVPSSVLPKVLAGGRFKTQFETKNSTGGYTKGNGARKSGEERLFGMDPDIAPEKRPIYGYVSGKDFAHATTHHEVAIHQYGDVVVRLKPEIRGRSTVTLNDSLESNALGVPANAPSHLGVSTHNIDELHAVAADKSLGGPQKLAKIQEYVPYIEAQHFGGVNAGDIAEVGFPKEPPPRVAKQLDKLGIPHRVLGDTTSDEARDRRYEIFKARRKESGR